MHRLTNRIRHLKSLFEDGGHDIISHR